VPIHTESSLLFVCCPGFNVLQHQSVPPALGEQNYTRHGHGLFSGSQSDSVQGQTEEEVVLALALFFVWVGMEDVLCFSIEVKDHFVKVSNFI
jgi:hypothetical protein